MQESTLRTPLFIRLTALAAIAVLAFALSWAPSAYAADEPVQEPVGDETQQAYEGQGGLSENCANAGTDANEGVDDAEQPAATPEQETPIADDVAAETETPAADDAANGEPADDADVTIVDDDTAGDDADGTADSATAPKHVVNNAPETQEPATDRSLAVTSEPATTASSGASLTAAAASTKTKAATKKTTSKSKTATTKSKKTAKTKTGALPNGTYIIRSILGLRTVVEVAEGSKLSGANVQLFTYNKSKAQKWKFTFDTKSGFYTIVNVLSGKVLAVEGGKAENGANIIIAKPGKTKAKLWKITADGSNWRIASALKSSIVLDIDDGKTDDGTNVQLWSKSKTTAQRFDLVTIKPKVTASTAKLANGVYVLSNIKSKKVVDIEGGSRRAKANVQQYASNSGYGQRFYIESNGKGYYRIFAVGSGLALTVAGGGLLPGTNVRQDVFTGSKAQLWSIRSHSDGSYSLVSKSDNLALAVACGSKKNGANVRMARYASANKAERFSFAKSSLLSSGTVSLYATSATKRAVTVKGSSRKSGAILRVSDADKSFAQKMIVSGSMRKGFTLREVCSGLYASAKGSKAMQSKAQTEWNVSFAKSGKRRGIIITAPNGKALTLSSSKNNAKLIMAKAKGSNAQRFCPATTNLISDGLYTIANSKGGKVLDVNDGDYKNGANIQIWKSFGNGSQSFRIEHVKNGYYRIVNIVSNRALDVAEGSKDNGANVQQYYRNDSSAQLWKAGMSAAGNFTFTNKGSGKLLSVSSKKAKKNGTNVNIWKKSSSRAQEWRVSKSSYKLEEGLQTAYDQVAGSDSGTEWSIEIDRGRTWLYVFQGQPGNWALYDSWVVSVGNVYEQTPTGTKYTTGAKLLYFNACMYATPFDYKGYYHGSWKMHSTPAGDDRLGYWISGGCIRMTYDHAHWIYDNVAGGTRVNIYN